MEIYLFIVFKIHEGVLEIVWKIIHWFFSVELLNFEVLAYLEERRKANANQDIQNIRQEGKRSNPGRAASQRTAKQNTARSRATGKLRHSFALSDDIVKWKRWIYMASVIYICFISPFWWLCSGAARVSSSSDSLQQLENNSTILSRIGSMTDDEWEFHRVSCLHSSLCHYIKICQS